MKRARLLAAVRDRMRSQTAARHAESRPRPARAPSPRPRPAPPDHRIEQLEAEAQYHRERFELYRARVISGSERATSPVRLRELERAATAAQERLAHARQGDRPTA